MVEARYSGLDEYRLPLIARDDPSFDALVSDIESRTGPGPALPAVVSDNAAVLLNNTGTAIVAFEWFWCYTSRSGDIRISQFSNFGSSAQREVLSGRSKLAATSEHSFFLAQSD